MKFSSTLLVSLFFFISSVSFVAAADYYYYPYQTYTPSALACSASVTDVRAGDTITFSATGGSGSTYNWVTSERTYVHVGSRISIALFNLGVQTVTVSSGSQVASCSVRVLPSLSSQPISPVYSYPVTYFTAQYVPGLPNTGFEPITAAAVAFAVVLVIAAGIFVLPYVKRTLASSFS